MFHRACIAEWLISHDECPYCRHPYLQLVEDDGNDNNKSSCRNVGDGLSQLSLRGHQPAQQRQSPPPPVQMHDLGGDDDLSYLEPTLQRGLQLYYYLTHQSLYDSDSDSLTLQQEQEDASLTEVHSLPNPPTLEEEEETVGVREVAIEAPAAVHFSPDQPAYDEEE